MCLGKTCKRRPYPANGTTCDALVNSHRTTDSVRQNRRSKLCCTLRHSRNSNKQDKDCDKRTLQHMILKIHHISYQMNLQATNLSTQRNIRKKRKSQGKGKLNQDKCETPKKKRNNTTSVPALAPVTAETPTRPVTPVTCAGPVTPETCATPVTRETYATPVTPATCATPLTPATCTTPVTPATQKGKGKSSTPKTPSVATPNPNDYGPLVPDTIEKALLETEVLNIVMYNTRIQGCYYKKCCHRWDPMFMILPNNMLFRMKTYREYTRESNGVRVKNTYRSNAFYCLETMESVCGVNGGGHVRIISICRIK